MKSRAAVAFEAKRPLEIIEVDLEGPKAGEVLIEIMATGIYHTDAYTLDGLSSGLTDQSQKITVAARAMAEKKTLGHRSRCVAEAKGCHDVGGPAKALDRAWNAEAAIVFTGVVAPEALAAWEELSEDMPGLGLIGIAR